MEDVAHNWTDIKESAKIGYSQTFLLEVSEEHNNTLFIQLSRDGQYWNVNSCGIFKKGYSRNKKKVHSVPAVGDGKDTDTTEVISGQTKGATAPAGNSSKTSVDKVSENLTDMQPKKPTVATISTPSTVPEPASRKVVGKFVFQNLKKELIVPTA